MNELYRQIIDNTIEQVKPDTALRPYLEGRSFNCARLYVIAIGKAGWLMAKTAREVLGQQITKGYVITKYNHSLGAIENFEIYEAGHPLMDENTLKASRIILDATENLTADDAVLFLLSGGGSALFEASDYSLEQLQQINRQLLSCNASISQINTIRKRLSKVKGGKFAAHCAPAKVYNYLLSDVIGNQADMIASGPTTADTSTNEEAEEICQQFHLGNLTFQDTVKSLDNVETTIIADVSSLCEKAQYFLNEAGYQTLVITDCLAGTVDQAVKLLQQLVKENYDSPKPAALLLAGELTVELKGSGKGGRCQQLICQCIDFLAAYPETTIIAFGSDGTDGPTEAAGGWCDDKTYSKCQHTDYHHYIDNNDTYHLLKKLDQLIITGPTNTNVNDLIMIIMEP